MKQWHEVEKRIIQTKYGPKEIPVEDCWMPDGRNIYVTLQYANTINRYEGDQDDDLRSIPIHKL